MRRLGTTSHLDYRWRNSSLDKLRYQSRIFYQGSENGGTQYFHLSYPNENEMLEVLNTPQALLTVIAIVRVIPYPQIHQRRGLF